MTRLLVLLTLCLASFTFAQAEEPKPLDDPKTVEAALAAKLPVLDRGKLTIESAMHFLGELGGVNVLVDTTAIAAAGYKLNDAVFVSAKNVDLKTAIDRTVASVSKPDRPLKWALENGVVVVSAEKDENWRWMKLAAQRSDQTETWKNDRLISAVDIDDLSLAESLKRLRDDGVNLYMHWASLKELGIDPHTRLTMKLRQVRPRTVVQVLVRKLAGPKASVTHLVHDSVWVIASREQADRLQALWRMNVYAAKDQASADKLANVLEDVSFNARPLSEAADDLSRLGEVVIDINWPAVAPAKVDRDTPIQLQVSKVKLSTALDLLLAEAAGLNHQMEYTVKDATVHVTLKKPPASKPATRPVPRR